MRKRSLIFLVVLFLLPLQAAAFDVAQLQIHGFLSQAYLDSSENNYLTANSKEGTTELNEVGLSVSSQINDKLRAGLQLLSRDVGDEGNNDVRLDWAVADYRYQDYLGVRVGKIKLPMGLYNEGRDADMLRPMVFLPHSIYDETRREMISTYQGAGIYGNLTLGPLGDLDYQGFYGSTNVDDESTMSLMMEQVSGLMLNLSGFPYAYQTSDFEIDSDYTAGGSLILNTALDGLRLGASWLTSQNNTTINGTRVNLLDGSVEPFSDAGEVNFDSLFVTSLEYTYDNFTLAGEFSENETVLKAGSSPDFETTSQSWYVMAAYTFFDRLTVSALYDEYYLDKDDKDGKKFAAQDDMLPPADQFLDEHLVWRKDKGVGVRYDITPNWLIKAEYHDIDGAEYFMFALNGLNELERDWNYFVVKSTLQF